MEIIYYWMKNKYNIHMQGFNFSPEIKCSLDYNKINNEYCMMMQSISLYRCSMIRSF